jgi:bifunctional DNA-binding transcriptional regulator/antitoxin component of YhaV-PrlF toxin-antitoxin module
MTVKTVFGRVSKDGRLIIPLAMRREMGLEKGGMANVILDDKGLHISACQNSDVPNEPVQADTAN